MVPIVYLQVAQKENKTLAQQLAGIIYPAFVGLFSLQTCQCSVGKRTSQFL